MKTSSHVDTEEATTSNTTNPEDYLNTIERTISTYQRREDHIEKGKGAEL